MMVILLSAQILIPQFFGGDPAQGAQWDEEWDGETHDLGDDMPGTVATPEFFSNLQHLPCNGCAWVAPTGLFIKSDSDRYGFQWDNNIQFHIWTW
jgi:hypothetical protein